MAPPFDAADVPRTTDTVAPPSWGSAIALDVSAPHASKQADASAKHGETKPAPTAHSHPVGYMAISPY